ncbi:MAG: DUF1598 domain-containing protein [Bythopirellula sp.]
MKRIIRVVCASFYFFALLLGVTPAQAQPALIPGIGPGAGPGQGPGQGNQPGGPQGNGLGSGAPGGAAAADFDSLIDLITSTVEADSWMENGTGEGEVQPFPTGVYADANGTLRFAKRATATASLASIPKPAPIGQEQDVRQSSALRYVSLPRLEAAIRSHQLQQQPLDEAMLTLAGLQRVEYVMIIPPTDQRAGDLLVAGRAGDWQVRPDGKIVAAETGQPIVRLDDLLTLWRRHQRQGGGAFGVSINPRQANLAKVQDYVAATGAQPLEPGGRHEWLKGLQQNLGQQDVEFFGINPDSHAARVLLVADYHMKLIGMGLADGVEGAGSYLSSVQLDANGNVPPMTVLRWWFAMQYDPVHTNAERTVFEIRGPAAKVLSENELLAARGGRVHTGQSEELNKKFAASFSEHFAEICLKYPLYAELRNVFDLSMVLALLQSEGLIERLPWQPTLFANPEWLPLPKMRVPTEVETVINHRVIRRQHIVAGVSGGVWIDARKTLRVATADDDLATTKTVPTATAQDIVWWWD